MLDDSDRPPSGEGSPERLAHDYLIELKGIGPYAAAHCRVLLHDFSRIPVDSSSIAYLRERHGCDPAAFAADRSAGDPTSRSATGSCGCAKSSKRRPTEPTG